MPDGPSLELSDADGAVLIATAREAIASRLDGRAPRWPAAGEALSAPRGAFVTLRSGRGHGAALRGCIGRMSDPEPLVKTVREMARAAAFEDPRFQPLEKDEYPGLSVEVTVLSPMRPIGGVAEIEVGRHGVYMTKGGHSAVFLPQVASEQGWSREELLDNLCYKAGLSLSAWRASDTRFQVFEGRIFGE
jgi:AmmeMemoRadiSam system protein A